MSTNTKKTQKPDKFILYIGDDDGYWASVCQRMKAKYDRSVFEFRQIRHNEFSNYQKLFYEILNYRPGFIYLDFSSHKIGEYFKLANLLKIENSLKEMPIVGLVDVKEKVEECIFAGVDVIHVKCGELHDVIYDPYVLAYPNEVKEAQFAKAQFERDVSLIADLRIGYISPTHIHAEGDMELEEGSLISLNTNIPKSIVPSRQYRVKSVDDKNLYYNYRFSYDLEFIYVDEPEDEVKKAEEEMVGQSEEHSEVVLKQAKENQKYAMAEYKAQLERSKKELKSWVMDNQERSRNKNIKILICDPKLEFINETEKNLDQYPYTIRLQTYLSEDFSEINLLRPDLISMQFYYRKDIKQRVEQEFDTFTHDDGTPMSDAEVEAEKELTLKRFTKEEETKAIDLVSKLVKKVKTFENYKPFIIIFNCEHYDSSMIQDSLKYPFVISNKGTLQLGSIINMADAFEKKNRMKFEAYVQKKMEELKKANPAKYRNLKASDFDEKRYYVSRQDRVSRANYRYPITLTEMSESECTFYCEKYLKLDTYRLDFPVDLSITLVPFGGGEREKSGEGFIYKALIHSVGEIEKKDIRRFVNEIFFSDLNEKRKAEQEAFESLNEQERLKRKEEEEQVKNERREELGDSLENEESKEDDD